VVRHLEIRRVETIDQVLETALLEPAVRRGTRGATRGGRVAAGVRP
jgi:hypothetical protein